MNKNGSIQNICVYGLTRDLVNELRSKYTYVFWVADNNEAKIQPNPINVGDVPECVGCADDLTFYKFASKNIGDFIRLNSRHNFIKNESYFYYEVLLYKMCKYLCDQKELKKIDFIVFGNIPHEGFDWVLLKYAEFKSIRYICLYQTLFPDKFIAWGAGIKSSSLDIFFRVNSEGNATPFYMKSESNLYFRKIFRFFFNEKKLFKLVFFIKNLRFLLKRNSVISKRTLSNLPDCNYVYFPLHLQPELTTSVFGGCYHNQILAVQELRQKISPNTLILIKENPKQNMRNRSIQFYRELLLIEGVYFVDIKKNSLELIDKSVAVASICGTAGYEALCKGKPAIYFGDAWYKNFNGAFHISEFSDENIGFVDAEEDILEFINSALNGIIDPMYYEISNVDYASSVNQTCKSIEMAIKANN